MVHCPDCETTLSSPDDVTFEDYGAEVHFLKASKRFYVISCGHCDHMIGSGVAGQQRG